MGHYLLKRFFTSIPALLAATLVVFFLLRVLPGDAVMTILADTPHSVQMREALRRELGLDRPAHVQYLVWLGRLFDGSFGGRSFETGELIANLVKKQLPVTFLIAGYTLLVSFFWSLPAGLFTGYRAGGVTDRLFRLFSLVGLSIPNILAASVLLLCLLKIFRWSPPIMYFAPDANFTQHLQLTVWPVLILSLEYGSHLFRVIRTAVIDTLKQQFVRGAKARGVPPSSLLLRHAMPPVASLALSVTGTHFSALIGGTLVLEAVFGLPGIGRGLVQAAIARDFPVIQSYAVLLVAIFIGIQTGVDLLHRLLNPRQRSIPGGRQ